MRTSLRCCYALVLAAVILPGTAWAIQIGLTPNPRGGAGGVSGVADNTIDILGNVNLTEYAQINWGSMTLISITPGWSISWYPIGSPVYSPGDYQTPLLFNVTMQPDAQDGWATFSVKYSTWVPPESNPDPSWTLVLSLDSPTDNNTPDGGSTALLLTLGLGALWFGRRIRHASS